MTSRCRFLWSKLSRLSSNHKNIAAFKKYTKIPIRNISYPVTVSFSIFTWMGFSDKLTVEDELIKTIKHCIIFIKRLEYDKAEQLLHIALRQAQQINHQLGITYIYDVMANLALEREQLEKAKKIFVSVTQRIMSDGATEDDPRVVHISVKLARISHLQKDLTTAQLGYEWCLQKLQTAISKDPSEDTKKLLAMTEDWYGRLYLDTNQYEYGLKLMMSSLEKMRKVPDVEPEHIAIQLNDIGTVCDRMDKLDESIAYFNEAIKVAKPLQMEDIGAMYVNLGRVYLRKNMIDEARRSCGAGWKFGMSSKNEDIKNEAESCLREVKMAS